MLQWFAYFLLRNLDDGELSKMQPLTYKNVSGLGIL
jgi:hypothetical protein